MISLTLVVEATSARPEIPSTTLRLDVVEIIDRQAPLSLLERKTATFVLESTFVYGNTDAGTSALATV